MIVIIKPTAQQALRGGIACRLWEGKTDKGTLCRVWVAAVELPEGHPDQLPDNYRKQEPPSPSVN